MWQFIHFRLMFFIFTIGVVFGCLVFTHADAPAENTSGTIIINRDIRLKPLAKGVWLHTTYHTLSGYGRVPGNGLLVVHGTSAVLIDLPWTNEQTTLLFDWVKKKLKANIESVIPTHSHPDCIGGLAEAHKRGAKSYAFEQTAIFAKEKGGPVPQITFKATHEVTCGPVKLMLDYPGGGHTIDNIVVWLPQQKILFGGCLIRSASSKTLGYTKEADLKNWPATLNAVKKKYGHAKMIIPGHGKPGGIDLVEHTLQLLAKKGTVL